MSRITSTSRAAAGAVVVLLATATATVVLPAAPARSDADDVVLVADIAPGPADSGPFALATVGDTAFLRADDGTHGSELWRTDGTAGGTALVADVRPGPEDSRMSELVVAGDRVYFVADDGSADDGIGSANGSDLWVSDGTAEGTERLTRFSDIATQPGEPVTPDDLVAVGDDLFFVVRVDEVPQLWRSDGTVDGTVHVARIGEADGYQVDLDEPVAVGDTLYFVADERRFGREVWRSDGTTAGTGIVADLQPGGIPGQPASAYPRHLTAFGDRLVFQAADDLYITDGTTAGTRVVVESGAERADLAPLGVVGDTLYFGALHMVHPVHRRLWKTDGTTLGTSLVADVEIADAYDYDGNGGPQQVVGPTTAEAIGDILYFTASDAAHGRELWRTDGTDTGTRMVADINPLSRRGYPVSSNPHELTAVGDVLFFTADDGANGREMWRSDGTASGTGVVADLDPNEGYPLSPRLFTTIGTTLFLVGPDPSHGEELRRTTSEATTLPVPVNLAAPRLTGSPTRGSRLEVSTGTWDTSDLHHTYRWFSGDYPLRGVTGPTYTVRDDDTDRQIEVQVVASRAGYASRAASSNLTAPVQPAPDPDPGPGPGSISNDTAPEVRGPARVGATLVATDGTWSGSPTTLSHQWYVDGHPIPAATAPWLTLPPGAVGHRLTVRVTAGRPSADAAVSESIPTAPVVLGSLRRTAAAAVRGQARVGRTLRLVPGGVLPAASRTSVQWVRDGHAVPGATRGTYRVTRRDVGLRVSVRVTYARPGYRSTTLTTRPTGTVPRPRR